MAPQSTSLGTASVKLTAENAELKARLAEAEARLERYGASAERAGTRANSAFYGTTRGIRQSIAAVTGFVGSMTAAIGVVQLMLELGQRIGNAFKSGAEVAQEAIDNLDVSSIDKAISELEVKIQRANDQITKKTGGNLLQRFVVEVQELFDKESEQLKAEFEAELNGLRRTLARQKEILNDNRLIDAMNKLSDSIERMQDAQRGAFGPGQAGNIDAVVELLQEIRNSGGRWRF